MYVLDETCKASAAVRLMLAAPVLLNQDVLAAVPANLIGSSSKVLLVGVITPSFKAPMTIAPLTTDPITKV